MREQARTSMALALAAAVAVSLGARAASATECQHPDGGLPVSRIVEIDTANGPLYGGMSRYAREESFLGPKEIVLTFDDGPVPAVTKPILDILDEFCTKATFFSVGRMAIAYPAMTKEIMARGHTLGTHTWSHPLNLRRTGIERARDEIERGFAAVAMAAGQPIAPFFRFPGLSDSDPMLALLQSRGIGAFTVDVVTNDSFIRDSERLIRETVALTVERDGGILLFHDIKRTTATALPEILRQLKTLGFNVVHIRPKTGFTPVPDYDATLAGMLPKNSKQTARRGEKPALIPMTAAAVSAPDLSTAISSATSAPSASSLVTASIAPDVPVTVLAPAAKPRTGGGHGSKRQQLASTEGDSTWFTVTPEPPRKAKTPGARAKKHRHTYEGEKRFFD